MKEVANCGGAAMLMLVISVIAVTEIFAY